MSQITIVVEAAILATEQQAQLRARFPAVAFAFAADDAAWRALAPTADVIFAKNVPADALVSAERLRWLQAGTAGVDGLLRRGLAERDVLLTNARGAHGTPIAEQILAMALAFASGLHLLLRAQPADRRVHERVIGEKFELAGQTLLVLGLGDIGGTLAEKACALSMRVLGVRRSGAPHPACERVYRPEALLEALPLADHVALCLPLTYETRHIMSARELRAMRPTAYLYNVGRGASIDGAALRQALGEGWIAGAGLDCVEPVDIPAPDDPLWTMEQVILGRHTSGSSPYNGERIAAIFAANLDRFLAGKPLQNVVERARGY